MGAMIHDGHRRGPFDIVATTAVTGAAVSAGVSGVGESNQTVEGEARRTAKEVAKPLSRFFVGQGWIPAEMVIK